VGARQTHGVSSPQKVPSSSGAFRSWPLVVSGEEKSDTDENASDGPTDAEYEAVLLFLHDIFEARYPTAKAVLNKERGATALKKYGVDVTSGESILSGVTLALHEDGHALDGALKRVGRSSKVTSRD